MSDNFMQLILLTRYILYNFIYLLIYFRLYWVFITVQALSGGSEWALFPITASVCRILIVVASLIAEHRL